MEKMKFEYSFDEESWLCGYDVYQRLYRKKKLYIYTAVFAVLSLLFLQQVIMDAGYGVGWICLAVSLGVIAITWLSYFTERKNLKTALSALAGDRYVFTLFNDRFTVKTILSEKDSKYLEEDENGEKINLPEIPETVVYTDDKSLKAYENDMIFAVFTESMQCIIPKKDLAPEALRGLKDEFYDKLKA